jgi:hypothetical protein
MDSDTAVAAAIAIYSFKRIAQLIPMVANNKVASCLDADTYYPM